VIDAFVKRFDAKRDELWAQFKAAHPDDYLAIVRAVVQAVASEDGYPRPDAEHIHIIDDGDYQGTLVFIIPERGYQPHDYWYARVWYGSCSGCDTLQDIAGYSGNTPTDAQADDYLTLALHIVQGLRRMNGDGDGAE
jgi:hypothetical protein